MVSAEDSNVLNYILTGGGAALMTQVLNAVINRKSRQTTDARLVVAGSVEWANAVHADNERLRDRFEALEKRFDAQQITLREHHKWDLMAARKIRDLDPDANFPDPPALEAAA